MKSRIIVLSCAMIMGAAAYAQSAKKWLPLHEEEFFVRGTHEEVSNDSYFQYDAYGRVAVRQDFNLDAVDSLVYDYDEQGRCIRERDFRGNSQTNGLFLYTDTHKEYDPIIPSLCIQTVGWQQVDQEWTLYAAQKIAITRDAEGQITRIGDYTPGFDSIPDIPISYVKTFTYKDGRLDSYVKELYMMNPVTEETYLQVSERWTDIKWQDYEGQVTDMSECFVGANRVKSARVFEDYYGYEYDLTVVYGEGDPANFVATQNIASASLRKTHTLTMLDANGSAVEEFSTYTLAGGEPALVTRQSVTVKYDEHHNLILTEEALTADREHPEVLSVRKGNKYEYDYSPEYGDWTTRRDFLFNQSYVDGEEGYYEQTARVDRSEWVELDVSGISALTIAPAQRSICYDLQGRATTPTRGIYLQAGRKLLAR